MANLITEYDGWKYYDNGTVIAPGGDYYHKGDLVWSPPSGGSSSFDAFSGWGPVLQGGFQTLMTTWSEKTLMQQNQQGQRYVEGQPIMLPASNGSGGLMLLALGALAVYMLAK